MKEGGQAATQASAPAHLWGSAENYNSRHASRRTPSPSELLIGAEGERVGLEGRERAGVPELLLERAMAFVCLLHPGTTRGRPERGFFFFFFSSLRT